MDSFDSLSRAWTSVASLVFIRITPTRLRKHTCNQVFNAARVCATPSVIIARFRGWKKWQPFNRFKGFSFSATFYIVWDRSMSMVVLIPYGLSVVVSRFFFSFFLFLSGKKERRLFGLWLLFRKWRGNFILW